MKFKFKLKNIISSRIYCGPGMLVVISSILAGRVKKDSLRDWHSCGRVVVNDCNSCGLLIRLEGSVAVTYYVLTIRQAAQ